MQALCQLGPKGARVFAPTVAGMEEGHFLLMVRDAYGESFLTGTLTGTTLHSLQSDFHMECEVVSDTAGYQVLRHLANGGSFDSMFVQRMGNSLLGCLVSNCMLFLFNTLDANIYQSIASFELRGFNSERQAYRIDMEN